jgi:hypothetical protein
MAIESGFVQRRSKLGATDFLNFLLFDHLQYSSPSLQQHALSFQCEEGKVLTKQAIDKRFNESSVLFIETIFGKMLSNKIKLPGLPSALPACFNSIRILDSTEFKLPDSLSNDFPGYGKSSAKACAAIQFEYDILSKNIHCLSLGNARESDKTFADSRINEVGKGDLLLRDLAYYSIDTYLKIEQREAFYVSRIKSQVNIYSFTGKDYSKMTYANIARKINSSGAGYFDEWVYIGEKQRHPVRMIASILPFQEQQKRLKRKQDRNGTIRAEDIAWSKLHIIITNVKSDSLNAKQITDLYRVRWQIELLFKAWKSIINIDNVRKMKVNRLKCYLFSKLIWALLCWDISSLAESEFWKRERKLISFFKATMVIKIASAALKQILSSEQKLLENWLSTTLHNIFKYGEKEHRKGRINLHKLLFIK